MTTTDCPPLPVRITKSLLGYGVVAGPIYVLAVAGQMAVRDGFDPTRHAASQLANGEFRWIQVATFLVTGAMTMAGAVGVRRALGPGRLSAWAAGLLGAYGAGLVAAGIFRADPSDGFPPGTPPGMGEVSWHGVAHSPWRASLSLAWSRRASCSVPGSPAPGGVRGRGSPASPVWCSRAAS